MKTLIDNDQRVFLVHRKGFFTRDYFCNLSDIQNVLKDLEVNDEFIIYEYFNKKFTKCSKKHLNEMFAANKIEFKIK